MSKRYTDEAWRKPRVAKGTPLYAFSSLMTLGVFALSGGCWYLFEHWSVARNVKRKVLDGELDYSPETKLHMDLVRQSMWDQSYHNLLSKLQERETQKEDSEKPVPWYVKILYSRPEI